jgi:hypothetical protein
LQRLCQQWKDVNLGAIAGADADAFDNVARDIIRDAKAVASNPTIGSIHRPGAMRPIVRVDGAGRKTTRWYGDPNSWMAQFHSPTIAVLRAVGDGYGNGPVRVTWSRLIKIGKSQSRAMMN